MTFDEAKIREALLNSWSKDTARQWTVERPFDGQCNVTAAVIAEVYGGEIVKTPWNAQTAHFYNRLGGKTYDFTDAQFLDLIHYADDTSSLEEARKGFSEHEFQTLRSAFLKNIETQP